MPRVGFAVLLSLPRRVLGLDNTSPLWLGSALSHEGEVRVYCKPASPEEALTEICSMLLADAIGLAVPSLYLIHDPDRHLNQALLIGSEDAGSPSLRQLVDQKDPAVSLALQTWAQLGHAAVFDEWIHNPDRNQGNLLYNGRGEWVLIDHARALGAWPPGSPVPDPAESISNGLAHTVVAQERDFGVAKMRRLVREFITAWGGADIQSPSSLAIQHLGMCDRQTATLDFLGDRLHHLPRLLGAYGQQGDLNI